MSIKNIDFQGQPARLVYDTTRLLCVCVKRQDGYVDIYELHYGAWVLVANTKGDKAS